MKTESSRHKSVWQAARMLCPLIGYLIFLSGAGGCRGRAPEDVLCIKPSARVDLGTLDMNRTEEVLREVELENHSAQAVRIHSLRSSCVCLDAKLSRKDIPGKSSTKVKLTVGPPFLPGKNRYRLYLHSDCKEKPVVPIDVTFFVKKPWTIDSHLVYFISDGNDLPLTKTLTFTGEPETNFALKSIKAASDLVEIGPIKRTQTEDGATVWRVDVILRKGVVRTVRTVLNVDDGTGVDPQVNTIPLIIEGQSPFEIDPPVAKLQAQGVGDHPSAKVRITRRDGGVTHAIRLECPSIAQAEVRYAEDQGYAELTIRAKEGLQSGTYGGCIFVECSDPAVRVQVPIIAVIQ